ncbi:hypothetical protein L1987_06549 [Smallanthus sonchifolius]|uniref:Uncharacterized protein n=1 Tax=Smallanthus sonchifolius TaxID=185202 RepID=A0ACB9JYG5_9ASTR|nr:hypothetical protein L1987_06549 [Smallanthus sonchifolius]
MLAVGNNCGNVGFWNIDSDKDNGIYVYHPHLGLISGISIHPYSLSKVSSNFFKRKLAHHFVTLFYSNFKLPGELWPISISDLSMSCQVDDKKLVRKIMGIKRNEVCCRVTRCVDVRAMRLDEKNIARVLLTRITEVKFFLAGDTRMPVVGNN